jgi:hypothetical protein
MTAEAEPRRRRGLSVPLTVALVVLALAAAAGVVWAVALRPAAGSPATPTTPAVTTAAAPVVPPSGDRGADWHAANATQPWARHVLAVNSLGRSLIVDTDLSAADASVALEICRAGHAYVSSIGAPDADVTVYAGGDPPKVRLAKSDDGAPCAGSL